MIMDYSLITNKKKEKTTKKIFIFTNDKIGSSSPQRGMDSKYYLNSNFVVNSTKNATPSNGNLYSTKNASKKSFDKSNFDQKNKLNVSSKIRILPRQTIANPKQILTKDYRDNSPPKDSKNCMSVNREKVLYLQDKSSLGLDQGVKNSFGNAQLPSKFTKLRIVSRDKSNPTLTIAKPSTTTQKEPLFIKKHVDGVSPKTKQRIDFCIKIDKLDAAKSRSNDIKKNDNKINEPINQHHTTATSENKDQTKYILQVPRIQRLEMKSNRPPVYTEKKEIAKNKFFSFLKNRFNESEEVNHFSSFIKNAFINWRQSPNIDLYQFKTPSEFYKIKYKIGKGCFGKVYLATQILTGCDVALKVISKTNMKNKDSRRKIEKEVAILKLVNQDHSIIKLFEVFEDESSVYLVFEYLPNGDLVQFFKKRPLFDEEELSPFYYKILKGIRHLHKNQILHRDIKLDNILLDRNLQPKVCDFGISSIVEKNKRIYDTGGTPAYLAPEVIKAEGFVCEKSDVWSLGVLLYLLNYGIVPFKANDMQVLYNKIISGVFKFPENDDASKDLVDLIEKMLVVDISKRFSLEQVMNHRWFKNLDHQPTNDSNPLFEKEDVVNEAVNAYLHLIGFPDDYVQKSIERNIFDHIKACRDTLFLRFLRQK